MYLRSKPSDGHDYIYRPLYIPLQIIQFDICSLEMKAAQVYFLFYLFIFGKCLNLKVLKLKEQN